MSNNLSKCNIYSRDVVVFPLSKSRNPSTSESVIAGVTPVDLNRTRLITEKSVSNLVYQLLDTYGFVIGTRALNDSSTLLEVEFNLIGYYFKIMLDLDSKKTENKSVYSDWDNIYASIKINPEYDEIDGQDTDSNVYTGLTLSNQLLTSESTYTLHILKKSNNEWVVPTESRKKFNSSSLTIERIDGKYR